MRKIYIITTFIIVLLVSFLGITYSYEYNENSSLKFELIGPYELYLDVYGEYNEYGVKVIRNGVDISDYVTINTSSLDMNRVGKYTIKYEILIDGNTEYISRIVVVKEDIKPEIKLYGDEIVYLNLYDKYIEAGYEVTDNYDHDLNNKVVMTSNLMVDKVGEYKIEYRVLDSSGNEAVAIRKIIVR